MTDYIDRMIEQTKKEDALREKGVIILNDYRLEKARKKDWNTKYKTTALKVMKVMYWYLCYTLATLYQNQNVFCNYTIQENYHNEQYRKSKWWMDLLWY